ncbi:hypothetical protein [Dietzia cercidiphylli]|nr:hypothetical protein [Dietzia cercidiphylli]MBB1046448.1 hypothetical protein [Dietzia cercidiphylli]
MRGRASPAWRTAGYNHREAIMDAAPDGLHLAALTITLSTDGGTEYVLVEADDDLAATTMLGMLDLAKAQILDRLT